MCFSRTTHHRQVSFPERAIGLTRVNQFDILPLQYWMLNVTSPSFKELRLTLVRSGRSPQHAIWSISIMKTLPWMRWLSHQMGEETQLPRVNHLPLARFWRTVLWHIEIYTVQFTYKTFFQRIVPEHNCQVDLIDGLSSTRPPRTLAGFFVC